MLDIALDEALGILRCVSSGFTSLEEAEVFARKGIELQALARMKRGKCLILVDAANTSVQSQESIALFSELATRREPGDRTAIVIGSALVKLQSERTTVKEGTGYFSNEEEALAWLLSED